MNILIDKILNTDISKEQIVNVLNISSLDSYLLYKHQLFCDLNIVISDKKYCLHKKIVSERSLFFLKFEFENNNIIDFECIHDDLEVIIKYLYDGKYDHIITSDKIINYYKICNFFSINIEKKLFDILYLSCEYTLFNYYADKFDNSKESRFYINHENIKYFIKDITSITGVTSKTKIESRYYLAREIGYNTYTFVKKRNDILFSYFDSFDFSIFDDFLNYIVYFNLFSKEEIDLLEKDIEEFRKQVNYLTNNKNKNPPIMSYIHHAYEFIEKIKKYFKHIKSKHENINYLSLPIEDVFKLISSHPNFDINIKNKLKEIIN